MALQKGKPSARKIGGHFLVRQFFLSQNKVISRSLLSSDVRNVYFHPKITLISKKESHTINQAHYLYFCPKGKMQKRGPLSWCYYEETEQYFAYGGPLFAVFYGARCGRSVRHCLVNIKNIFICFN